MSMDSLKNITDFYRYLDELARLKNCVIVIAAKDTIVTTAEKSYIGDEGYQKLQTLGLKFLRKDNIAEQFWSGYAAVIAEGQVIYEKLARRENDVEFETSVKGINIQMFSSSYKNQNKASIKVNTKETAVNNRGFNIVVVDILDGIVKDAVAFDTWAKSREVIRIQKNENTEIIDSGQKHYDIGIFGLWYGRNYGSMITYYALNEVLKDMGYSTVMIKNPLGKEGMNLEILPKSHSLRFAAKHYEVTPLYNLNEMSNLNRMCDCFVLGSDQMWNYGLSKAYKQSYFFDFVEKSNKAISYATSFGKDTYKAPMDYTEEVKKNLQNFAAISVRDDFSKEICAKNFGVKATQVLDSVFLCPVEKYDELTKECTSEKKDFLFVYVLDPNPEFGKEIKKIAEKTGKHIIIIFNEGDNKVEAKRRLALEYTDAEYWDDATVGEWLYCFKNANFVITDSFHGSVFASIFSNEFIVKKNLGRGGKRFDCIMEQLGLKDRMVDKISDISGHFEKVYNQKIDYNAVRRKIQPEIDQSMEWFRNVLKTPKENLPSVVLADKSVMTPRIWNTIKCTGCGVCANICPVGAIAMRPNSEGFLNPEVNYDKCINCGLCVTKCIALKQQYINTADPKCFAFWASDEIRATSSSGGVFTVAAEQIIDKGGYVAGTVYNEDFSVRHTIISRKEDLWRMRGSKYMQSDVRQIYKDVKEKLEIGKPVLFTGLPCHVAALYSYLGNKKYENLYTIDLVCHGITSQKVFDKFHKDVLNGKKLTDLQFKAKQPWGWHAGTNAKFEDGTMYSVPLEKCPYFIAYLKCISKNTTCGECQFNKLPRQADLSIGDFWGINKFNAEFNDQKGTSEILVNNEHGAALLEEIKPKAKLLEPVPLDIALNGNRVMVHPYRMHKNREYFFKHLDNTEFRELTLSCFRDTIGKDDKAVLEKIEPNMHNLYYLGKIVAENAKGRKIVAWGDGQISKKILKKYFNLDIAFTVYAYGHPVNGTTTRAIETLKGKRNAYYIVSLSHNWDAKAEKLLGDLGFEKEKDYIFRVHKPIVLENYDLSKGNYSDIYGNQITGTTGVLKKVVFRGLNSRINMGKNIHIGCSITFDMDTNALVEIGDSCRFVFDVKFEMNGNVIPLSTVKIGAKCRFLDALFRVYGHSRNSSIVIGDESTFNAHLDLHANAGKKLNIGRDCMFSHDISVWAGDGHTLFDVRTGKNTNSDYDNLPQHKNEIVIGDHVWVGKGAFILAGTNIDKGSVIGAQSVVKGKYPNNCVIAGNPAKLVKYDIAWSRDIVTTDIKRCGSEEYVALTKKKDKRSVLILGGTGRMSSKLTALCLSKGDDVTIAVRGRHKIDDTFSNVKKIIFNRLNEAETKEHLRGKAFDVVFDCSGLVPQSVDWVLSSIMTNRYIYVSSFETYALYNKGYDLREDSLPLYDPVYEKSVTINDHCWYQRGKRSSELLIANKYPTVNYAIVRIPFVMSCEDEDYDDELSSRVMKYVSAVIEGKAINEKNIDLRYSFVESEDEAKFLYYMSENNFKGVINFASQGSVTMREVIQYVEKKTEKKAIYDVNAKLYPFSRHPEVVMNLDQCLALSYQPIELGEWFFKKVDKYIDYSIKQKEEQDIPKEKIQNWLVTGGSTGFGKALVLRLHELGYKVAAVSRDKTKLEKLPKEIIKIELDVRDIAACRKAVDTAIKKLGKIDVLVNNAGLLHTSTFEETPIDVGEKIMETNYWGVSNMIKSIIPHMRRNKNGTVINISSARGFSEENYASYYVSSKFAVDNLTKNLKFECRKFMRFMAVELGAFNTGILQRRTIIHSQISEYKNLPPIYPYEKGYTNVLNKAVNSVIEVINKKALPRDLILGWDAFQQFQQAMHKFEKVTEQCKSLSISTDAEKKAFISLKDITLPRNKNLKIQNWLITGGSGGFGRIIALRLHALGYTVAVTSRDISRISSLPKGIYKIESKLENEESCKEAIGAAIEKMGTVDVLVNNATNNCWSSFEECPDNIMKDIFYVNFTMPAYMIKAILPYFRTNKSGTVVNITSIAGIQPRAQVSTYSAAKAALEGLTRTLKSECQRFARFMAVEPVCMGTGIMIHNPVLRTTIEEYKNLGRYTQEIQNIPNRKDIAAQQIINVVNEEILPQSLLIGTESYLIARNEQKRAKEEFEEYKEVTLSVCDKK